VDDILARSTIRGWQGLRTGRAQLPDRVEQPDLDVGVDVAAVPAEHLVNDSQ